MASAWHDHLSARGLLDLVLDEKSFQSWDEPVDHSGVDDRYRRELKEAAEQAGTDESVLTGRGMMRGRPVAVVVNEFAFLAGSIGRAAADRIVSAVRRATAEGILVVAATASGGNRMQEGTPAFVQRVDITRAIMDHRAAGLPCLIYLRHPTTGGVFASRGSLAHVTIAEPGALIGLLGPKVFELLEGRPFPPGVQTAENLADHGIIDAVVLPDELPSMVDRALGLLVDPPTRQTRGPRRAEVREVLPYGSDATVRLQGNEKGERDSAMIVALPRVDGQPCVVIGQDRTTQTRTRPMGPAAMREARRRMRPADELSPEAEQGAVAGEIARCISWMSTMRVPTVSVLLGQGCGGGALALLPADVVIAAENAWLSPLPPEGAGAIVFGDLDHAEEMSQTQRDGALDLHAIGTVHRIVPEPVGDTPESFARAVAAEVGAQRVASRSR